MAAAEFTNWIVLVAATKLMLLLTGELMTICRDNRTDIVPIASVLLVALLIGWLLDDGKRVVRCIEVRLLTWPCVSALHNFDLSILPIALLIC